MKRKNSMKMVASRKKKKDKKSKRKTKPKSETRKSKEEKTKRLKNSHLLVRCVLFEFIFALLFLLCGIGEFFLREIVLAIALFMFAVIFIILGVELWTAFWFRVPCLLLFHTLLCAVLILSILSLSTLLTLVYDTELLGREELGNSILGILFVSLFACGLFVLFGVAAYLLYNELEPLETVVVRPKSGMKGQPLGSSEGSLSNAMNRSQNDNVANQKWCGPFISVTESTQSLSPVKPAKKPKVKKMKIVEKPIKSPSLTTSQTIQSSVAKTQSLSLQTANTKEDTEKETKQKPPAIAIKAISETNVEPASRAKSKSSYIQELDEVNALIESTLSKTKDQTRTQSELGSHSSEDDKMEMPRAYSVNQFSSSDCNYEPPSYTELLEREMKRYTTPRETQPKLGKRHEHKTTSRRRPANTRVKQETSRSHNRSLNSSSIPYSSVRDRSKTIRSLFLADRPIVIEVKDQTTRTETVVTEGSTEDLPYYISSRYR